jgi:uridine kinase
MPIRIVAIDGYGGAGKSTLARTVASAFGDVPIVPTDSFANWDNQFDWWPRLLEQVIAPLPRGHVARYQRFVWDERRLAEWVELPPKADPVIIEGVSAMRSEFDPYLAYRVWVDAPAALRLRRGLERDGDAMRPQWERWMAAEEAYVEQQQPVARADMVFQETG